MEVIPILQIVTSRSAVLGKVPPTNVYSLPGLDPSGSGRVLDLAAAAAAVAVPLPESEPVKMELAGPVLEFSFDVMEETSLLVPDYILTNQDVRADLSSAKSDNLVNKKKELMVMNDNGISELFCLASSNWNKPGICQVIFVL